MVQAMRTKSKGVMWRSVSRTRSALQAAHRRMRASPRARSRSSPLSRVTQRISTSCAAPADTARYALRASAPSIMPTVFVHAVDRDERAEARALLLAEQHLVEHVEPVERDARAAVLRRLLRGRGTARAGRSRRRRSGCPRRVAPAASCDSASRRSVSALRSASRRLAELLRRRDEVAIVVDRVADHRVELRMRLRRDARPVAADEAPQRLGILGVRRRHQRQQQLERDRHVGLAADCPNGCARPDSKPLLAVLALIAVEELLVLVDVRAGSRRSRAASPPSARDT